MTKYISVFEYAKRKGTKPQNVYRWIREKKFKNDDIILEEKVVKRIRINNDAKPF